MNNSTPAYYTTRAGKAGTFRHFFQPPTRHRADGWTALRLHDAHGIPIADPAHARAAVLPLVDIYRRWLAGEPGFGPHMIDQLGRAVALPAPARPSRRRNGKPGPASVAVQRYAPGTIGAICRDFVNSDKFQRLGSSAQQAYRYDGKKLIERFGTTQWREISKYDARAFIMEYRDSGCPSGAARLYRTARAMLNRTGIVYQDRNHPGIVPEAENPFRKLDIPSADVGMIVWPREACVRFVQVADAHGYPQIGDAIVIMSWLATRQQDWIKWPADHFDAAIATYRQTKTRGAVVHQWSESPELVGRIEQAIARHKAAIRSGAALERFMPDENGQEWHRERLRRAFVLLRTIVAAKHPEWHAGYYVGLIAGKPLAIPTAKLTLNKLRHTAITFYHDAGVSRERIASISGHHLATIDAVLACYTARTATQSAAAMRLRARFEATGEDSDED